MDLKFTLSLGSDYHISAGHGLGSQVDSALLRDDDGVPVIRGSTIEGLLRDGLWQLLQTGQILAPRECKVSGRTEDGAPSYCAKDQEQCPICAVFGSPAQRKSWHFSSGRPVATEAPMQKKRGWQNGHTGAQVAARVRVNPRLRRAEARKLFRQEEGDRRLAFTVTVSCAANDAQAHHEAALLVAAARAVRRLGSARRRGRGECVFRLDEVSGWHDAPTEEWQKHLLDHFQQRWLQEQDIEISVADAQWNQQQQTAPVANVTARRFRLLVRTDEPVIIASRAEAGNIYDGNEFIGGATLLGALADAAASRWDLSDPQVYGDFLNVFRRGHARFSPLYPAYASLAKVFQTIPAPLDWLLCKAYGTEHREPISYAVVKVMPDDCETCGKRDANVQLIPSDEFLAVRKGAARAQTRRREELHPRINPRTQRVATGNLFGYVGLQSGQYLTGEVWCRDEAVWETLCGLTGVVKKGEPFRLRLGKATRRGYGLVTAWMEEITDDTLDVWRGRPLVERVKKDSTAVTLTLLTDVIVPDSWGRFRQTFDLPFLKELIGEQFVADPDPPDADQPIQVFCKAGYVDNFNHKLGLPRWRDIALKAGSAVGIRLKTPPNDEAQSKQYVDALLQQLQKIEDDGIGLRRNEGFGCVAFNHPVYGGGAGIDTVTVGLTVPEPLRLVGEHRNPVAKEAHGELKNWVTQLRKDFRETFFLNGGAPTNEEEKNWRAVARWLRSAADEPVDDLRDGEFRIDGLKTLLQRFGKAELLTTVKREKESFFAEPKRAKGIKHLLDWLDKAAAQQVSLEARRRMIELLAERLAATVKRGES